MSGSTCSTTMEPAVLRWPGGKGQAFISSWDDGHAVADRRLIGILNKTGLKGTFCLNSSLILNREVGSVKVRSDEVAELYRGHEIAIHGASHPWATRISSTAWLNEVMKDRERLEEWSGQMVRGASWPFGSSSDSSMEILKAAGISYCRGSSVKGRPDFWVLPEGNGWYRWAASCSYSKILQDEEGAWSEFLSRQDVALFFFIAGHSWDLEKAGHWEKFEKWCATTGSNPEIWPATCLELHDYVEAWRRLQWSMDGRRVFNPSAVSIWIKAGGSNVELPSGQETALFCGS